MHIHQQLEEISGPKDMVLIAHPPKMGVSLALIPYFFTFFSWTRFEMPGFPMPWVCFFNCAAPSQRGLLLAPQRQTTNLEFFSCSISSLAPHAWRRLFVRSSSGFHQGSAGTFESAGSRGPQPLQLHACHSPIAPRASASFRGLRSRARWASRTRGRRR